MQITTCPKCAYQRLPTDRQVHQGVCPACGIAYQKYLERQQGAPAPPVVVSQAVPQPAIMPAQFWGRVAAWLLFAGWGARFMLAGLDWTAIGISFMHNVNLPFHEFGHVLFMPFGRFLHILGGSLFQVAMPLGLMALFLFKQGDRFAAGLMLWWSGQSLVDLAPYIGDAQYRVLPLVGAGGEDGHDWGNLLTMLHWIERAHTLSRASFTIGCMVMAGALAWAAAELRRQYRQLRAQGLT
jgi:hypothetical protein